MAHSAGLSGFSCLNNGSAPGVCGGGPFTYFIEAAQATDADIMAVEAADINAGRADVGGSDFC
jgi:hypothetical protein